MAVSYRLIQWNTCSGVYLKIVSRWTQEYQRLLSGRAGQAPRICMEHRRGNLVGYSGLCVAVFLLSVTKHERERERERAYVVKSFGTYDHYSFINFLIRKVIWRPKNTIPFARGFSSWLAAVASVAILMGTGNEGFRSSAWKCLGRSPVRFSLQARWVVVCQEVSVTGGKN